MQQSPKTEIAEEVRRGALPAEGFVRITAILGPNGPIPVSKSTWWAGVKSGKFPPPVKMSKGVTVWRVEDIRALIKVEK
jgi:prophage regulatory protein